MIALVVFLTLVCGVTSHSSGAMPRDHCRNLRSNNGPGDVLSYHNVEQNLNVSSGLNASITRMTNEPPVGGIANHYKYRIRLALDPALSVSLAGWMVQVRDNGSQGGDYGALVNGTIRGFVFNESDSVTTDTWICPQRLGGSLTELPNGITHKDATHNNNPSTPAIKEIEFDWVPLIRNGTNADGTPNYVSDIPKCGKVVTTIMLKQKLEQWWHALETSCFVSWTQDGTPIDCQFDSAC